MSLFLVQRLLEGYAKQLNNFGELSAGPGIKQRVTLTNNELEIIHG